MTKDFYELPPEAIHDDDCPCESCEYWRKQVDCDHDYQEVYYGHECRKCQQFYAFGNAPWDDWDKGDDYEDDFGDEPGW